MDVYVVNLGARGVWRMRDKLVRRTSPFGGAFW